MPETKKKQSGSLDFLLADCGPELADQTLEMLKTIYRNLTDKHLLIIEMDDQVFRSFFQRPNIVRGAFVNGKLVGCLIISFRPEALVKFYEAGKISSDQKKIAYLEFAMIREEFRGYGLMKKILSDLEKTLSGQGVDYIGSIASPDNFPSVESLRAAGYQTLKRFIHQPSGYVRDIFLKKIR